MDYAKIDSHIHVEAKFNKVWADTGQPSPQALLGRATRNSPARC